MRLRVGILALWMVGVCSLGADCENGGPAAALLPQFGLTAGGVGDGRVLLITEEGEESFSDDLFNEGEIVRLRATADVGWIFDGWSGGLSGNEEEIEIEMRDDVSVTANFLAVGGVRTVTINGMLGRMTLAVRGEQARGNLRIGNLGGDLQGAFKNGEFQLTSASPGYEDAEIVLRLNSDGSLTGTIDGSGFDNDAMSSDPVALAWATDELAGQRTTDIDGSNGLLTVVIDGEILRGTWRIFGSFGADIEGSIKDGSITFTATVSGVESASVNATVQADGSWVGTIDGSGFSNEPFRAEPSFFP